ncbi:MAG: hypothetical protein WC586_01820 [Methanoregula sp.]
MVKQMEIKMADISESIKKDKIRVNKTSANRMVCKFISELIELNTKKIIIRNNRYSSYIWNIPNKPKSNSIYGNIVNYGNQKWVFNLKPDIVYHFADLNSVSRWVKRFTPVHVE